MKHTVRRVSTTGMLVGMLSFTSFLAACSKNSAPTSAGETTIATPSTDATTAPNSEPVISTVPPPPDGVYSTEETIDDQFPKLDPVDEARFLELLHSTATATAERVENQVRDVPVGGESILSLGRGYCVSMRSGEPPLQWLLQYAAQAKGRGDYEAVLLAYATSVAAVKSDSLCPETAAGNPANDAEMIAVVKEAWEWENNNKR